MSNEKIVTYLVVIKGPDGQVLMNDSGEMKLAAADEMFGHVWDSWDEHYGV